MGPTPTVPIAAESARESEAFESALEILEPAGAEYAGGLANHGPMAVEALIALSRPEDVLPWVEWYARELEEDPRGAGAIPPERWREALGDYGRVSDWAVFFAGRFEEGPWRAVLSDWCGRLAPGIAAAAFHGVIRTAHAARALARRETPGRRRELARGLAYWAARYQTLPERPGDGPDARLRPSEAIAQVEPLPADRRGSGFIMDRLAPLEESPSFAGVADLVDVATDAGAFLSDLTRLFARIYLGHATDRTRIALVHAVTGPSAVRLLLPHLDPAAAGPMLRYAWQAAAAIYAASARERPDLSEKPQPPGIEDLVERGVATRDEHGFKFVEACLRENAVSPDPVFLAAALDATRHLGRGAGGS